MGNPRKSGGRHGKTMENSWKIQGKVKVLMENHENATNGEDFIAKTMGKTKKISEKKIEK